MMNGKPAGPRFHAFRTNTKQIFHISFSISHFSLPLAEGAQFRAQASACVAAKANLKVEL
jgi:hypothetical protein